ncbi:MAG: hypothetical protein H6599_10220 [Flavobacteriales bacterium]|nr:hypothetical protein [Flavobacteriales bacterium]
MRGYYFLLVFLAVIPEVKAQKHHDIRKTIGVNFSMAPADNDRLFYQEKFGFIYRQCFGKFTLQTEISKMWQQQNKITNWSHTDWVSGTTTNEHLNVKQRKLNCLQVSLLKGWTNDLTNLYVGAGINTGLIKEDGYYSKSFADQNRDLNHLEKWSPKYIMIALTCTAAIEFRIMKNLSGMIKYNPIFSWNYRISKPLEDQSFLQSKYPYHYKQMTHSGLELSVHLRL